MPRKRKVASNLDGEIMPPPRLPLSKKIQICGPLTMIFEKAQMNETLHKKYFKELMHIYERMEHEQFMRFFLAGLRVWLKMDEMNTYANTGLEFAAKFITSIDCDNSDTTHPIMKSSFDYFLDTTSLVSTVRFRLCQFVNLVLNSMGPEAAIDDSICDEIMKYMLDRMKDYVASVRVQAVNALQRLQIPENPDDPVVRVYSYHLNNDPSALVRQAVLTAIGQNPVTLPIILERLWDVDERVRRRTYLQLSSFPVKQFKVENRLTLLEQGLNDHSESVRKNVATVLLPQWHQLYNKKYLTFLSALKLDANIEEIQRFVKISKQALCILFKKKSLDDLIKELPLSTEGEFARCVPFEKLTVEITVFWLALIEFIQRNSNDANDDADDDAEDDLQNVICELSTFCDYLSKYLNFTKEPTSGDAEVWNAQENQYKIQNLIEILLTFDLGDEIGRQNLKAFAAKILSTQILGESIVEKLVCCVEKLIPDTESRLQYFIDITRGIIEPNTTIDVAEQSISAVLDNIKDPETKVKIVQQKLKIMELRELESELSRTKNYARLEKVSEDLAACNDEFVQTLSNCTMINAISSMETINELKMKLMSSSTSKKLTTESILQCLQICFFAVCSKYTEELTPNMFQLYEEFVRRHMKSKNMEIRDRALKCGVAFAMLYEQLAKDVYEELYQQFVRHQQPRLWTTAVHGMCEMFDKYGIGYFVFSTESEKSGPPKTRKTRQLYNRASNDEAEEEEHLQEKSGVNMLYLFAHLFETCIETSINRALATGFCRLILGGHYEPTELITKILLKFFTPTTPSEINQIFSVFFETLIKRRKQECLAKALLPTVLIILDAPNDNPLHEIKPESVIKFVVNATVSTACMPNLNIHNQIASSFITKMKNTLDNKDLIKLLSKELLSLEVVDEPNLRENVQLLLDNLRDHPVDEKIESCIKSFKDILLGVHKGPIRKTAGSAAVDGEHLDQIPSDDDEASIDTEKTNNEVQMSVVDSSGIVDRVDESGDATDADIVLVSVQTSTVTSMLSSIRNDTRENEIDLSKTTAVQNQTNELVILSSNEENRSVSKVARRGRKKKLEKAKSKDSKSESEESENCRVVSSTQKQSDDDDNEEKDSIPITPTAMPVAEIRKNRKVFLQKNNNEPSPQAQKETEKKSDKTPVRSSSRNRHRLSQAHVKINRLRIDQNENSIILHRTRNALVAEFKEQNIMTRKRRSVDQLASPTRRLEHLKKIAPNMRNRASTSTTSSPTTSAVSSRKSSISSTISQSPRRGNKSPPPPQPIKSSARQRIRLESTSTNSSPSPRRKSTALKSQSIQLPSNRPNMKRTRQTKEASKDATMKTASPIVTQLRSQRYGTRNAFKSLSQSSDSSPSATPKPKRRNITIDSTKFIAGISEITDNTSDETNSNRNSNNFSQSKANLRPRPNQYSSTNSSETTQNHQPRSRRVNQSLQSNAIDPAPARGRSIRDSAAANGEDKNDNNNSLSTNNVRSRQNQTSSNDDSEMTEQQSTSRQINRSLQTTKDCTKTSKLETSLPERTSKRVMLQRASRKK